MPSPHKFPRMDHEQIVAAVEAMQRSPFRDVLARFLACAPTDAAITVQAEKYPDRWGQVVAIIARLAGYTEKLEVEATFTHKVEAMSDAELSQAIADAEAALKPSGNP